METLDDWNARYAEHEAELTKVSSRGYDWQFKVNYPIRVKQARVEKSQRGDVQLALDLEILDANGSVVAHVKEWQQLPKQASDKELPIATVLKITQMRRDNCGALLGAAERQLLPYHQYEDTKERRTFHNEDGTDIDREELKQRTVSCNGAILRLCDELHGREGEVIDELTGAELYVVKSENKKNADFPYTSFHAIPAFKLATYQGEG